MGAVTQSIVGLGSSMPCQPFTEMTMSPYVFFLFFFSCFFYLPNLVVSGAIVVGGWRLEVGGWRNMYTAILPENYYRI